MKGSRTMYLDGIGPVLLEKSSRARRITMTVRPQLGIRVAVPQRVSYEEAADFVRYKRDWLKKTLETIAKNRERQRPLGEKFAAMDKKTVKTALCERLRELAREHGFIYHGVTIRNQKTRWGSCSYRNTISLNAKLAILPPDLRDYVILHELAHTRVHNHSAAFWRELEKHVPGAKRQAARLKEYDLKLL